MQEFPHRNRRASQANKTSNRPKDDAQEASEEADRRAVCALDTVAALDGTGVALVDWRRCRSGDRKKGEGGGDESFGVHSE